MFLVKMEALEITLDEVALEGLDGITINSLWIRLESRQPPFPLKLDSMSKEFLFKYLVSSEDVSFHLLPQDRETVTIYNRFLDIDPETGIQEMRGGSDQHRDVYPVSVVQEDPNGIQGSCLYYQERVNISALIRTESYTAKLTLQEAHARWGEKLVIVASQNARTRALIGREGNPELKLSDLSYCILERLGRARWQGELQRDLHTCAFRMDAGKLHYLRKSLDKNKLITMQSHVVRLPTGAQQHSILLLLKRFHIDRRSKYDILMELTSNILTELPNNIGIMLKLRDQLRVGERTFKKMYQYMLAAKLVSIVTLPLQDLNPDAGPCKTKRGTDIQVRCLKLLKPYNRNKVDDDDDDDEDGDGPVKKNVQVRARDVERDMLAQAYEIVVMTGTKGISQTELRGILNIGKLESRMICRILERNQMIKGFMEDEGRQRTTKYISKIFVEKSKLNLNFTKERERSEKLQAPPNLENTPLTDTPLTDTPLTDTPLPEQEPEEHAVVQEEPLVTGKKMKSKSNKPAKSTNKGSVGNIGVAPPKHSTPHSMKAPPHGKSSSTASRLDELSELEERDDSLLSQDSSSDHTPSIISQSQDEDQGVLVFEEIPYAPVTPVKRKREESHQTYRLLKRKNMIIEAVRNLKVIEGLYTLQKKLTDEEKMDGVSTKVCKKSVLRLIRTLARDGFLKLYRTTVIQDGVTKKVDFVVHPSVTPDDPLVKSAIEQVRFKISSSYTVNRLRLEEARRNSIAKEVNQSDPQPNRLSFQGETEKMMGVKQLKDFKPSIVPGLSRTLGYQPKMPRLRMLHTFLWYLVYGHPLNPPPPNAPISPSPSTLPPNTEPQSPQRPGKEAEPEPEQQGTDPGTEQDQFKVYVNEVNWKRFIPPLRVHREFGYGWALNSDVLISLPLSVFIQIVQVNYKVDGLDEYLKDPVKQHYLIRFLPSIIKTQLLHRRKYLFSYFESLQKLCYMGLLQFGPMEKFMEKDQCFIFLKKHATVVDTTMCDPHYKLAVETTRPFERRRYSFNTGQDVESYWFDLLCVCLNTPLGVFRSRYRNEEEEGEEPDVAVGAIRYKRLQYTLKGSADVIDDGVTPGDGQGAGGLDSSFFTHLKRNWQWTTHLLNKSCKAGDTHTMRLRNLLYKRPLPKSASAVIQSGGPLAPPAVIEEEVKVGEEPSSRNQRVRGGKKQKRKRLKKEIQKPPKKKRKVVSVRKQNLCHDETDRKALMKMTRQRVTWTHLEDSLLMLCRVASHFLNRKLKKPFVGWNVIRDILHKDLELSQDKTSLAVGRRSRYIMKNPQSQLNYRICLAEVHQDKALVEDFMNRNDNYNDPDVCAAEFKEFVRAIRAKFSSSYGPCDVIIPDTKEELFNKFKVYSIGEESARTKDVLTSEEDIHFLVLNNLIQSTLVLSSSQSKTCLSFQAFSLYSNYKQEVLLQVFLNCKKRGLVNRRRANQKLELKKNRAVPCLPMSYQLSQRYYRFFTWRFPGTLYNEVYNLLEALNLKGRGDRPNTFSFQKDGAAEEVKERSQNEEQNMGQEQNEEQNMGQEQNEEQNMGQEQNMEQNMGQEQNMEQNMGQEQKQNEEQNMEHKQNQNIEQNEVTQEEESRRDEGEQEQSGGLEDGEHLPEYLAPLADVEEMLVFPVDAAGGATACCLTLMTLGLISVDVSIPQQIVVVDSTLVDNEVVKSITKELDEEEEEEGGARFEVKAHQASHTNYLLMRGYYVPGIISLRNITSTEHIAVNACTLHIQLRHTSSHTLFTHNDSILSSTPPLPCSLSRLIDQQHDRGRGFLEECVPSLGYTCQDVEVVQELMITVETEAELGVDLHDMCSKYVHLEHVQEGRSRTLRQYIQDLIDREELLEVGAVSPRLVCMRFASPWLLRCPMKSGAVCPRSQDPPPTPADPTPEAASTTNDGDLEVPPTLDTPTLKRPLDLSDDDVEAPPVKRSNVETVAMAMVASTVDPVAEVGGVECLPPDPPTSDRCQRDEVQASKESLIIKGQEIQVPGEGGSTENSEEQHALGFIARPWRIVDGSVNRPVCKGMLEAMMLHIMTHPGVPEPVLLQHYSGALQPMVVLDLLKALTELQCVKRRFTVNRPKATLFSRPSVPTVRDQARFSITEDTVAFYEPMVDCSLKLAQLFPHEPNWNKWVQLCSR